jgi:hypothetical protein
MIMLWAAIALLPVAFLGAAPALIPGCSLAVFLA